MNTVSHHGEKENNVPIVGTDPFTLPNLGYHYDPLDYAFSGDVLGPNTTITVNPGTAIAFFKAPILYGNIGLYIGESGAQFNCQGTATSPNRIVEYTAVQESTPTPWGKPAMFLETVEEGNINCQFTDFSIMADDAFSASIALSGPSINFQNCQFQGGKVETVDTIASFINCLFERVGTSIYDGGSSETVRNDLFWNGSVSFGLSSAGSLVQDNMFYQSTISDSSTISYIRGYNGYYTTNGTFLHGTNATDQILTNDVGYEKGILGYYYLPANSPLIDAGSTTAGAVGLNNFTTQTNQTPDIGPVDIGYHYAITGIGDSTGTNFWVTFFNDFYQQYDSVPDLSLYISSSVTATGTVSSQGLHGHGFTNTFSVAAGAVTNITLPLPTMNFNYETIYTNGIQIAASAPVSVYGVEYVSQISSAFTAYPTSLLGTNYCVMAYYDFSPGYPEFEIVATASNTMVTITPTATEDLEYGTNSYTVTNLQPGETYSDYDSSSSNDVTGTLITSTQPIAVFAGAGLADVPSYDGTGNPLVQEQLPVDQWGKQVLGLSFDGRLYGDTYRVLAAYSNTVVTITTTNGTTVITNQAGQFYETNGLGGPVEFQGSQPIQVAHFANGEEFDNPPLTNGDPCEILLLPVDHYLETNTVFTLTNNVAGDFDENYLNIIVAQSATNSTSVDGSTVAASNFVAIGTSGYYGAQITVTNSGKHTVTSSQPVGVEVYGFGSADAYGYFGGVVK